MSLKQSLNFRTKETQDRLARERYDAERKAEADKLKQRESADKRLADFMYQLQGKLLRYAETHEDRTFTIQLEKGYEPRWAEALQEYALEYNLRFWFGPYEFEDVVMTNGGESHEKFLNRDGDCVKLSWDNV